MFQLNIKHIISFLSLSLFMFIAIGTGDNDEVEEDISGKDAEVKVSASKLYSDYDGNEAAGDKKYEDKVIEVTGKIVDIKSGVIDDEEVVVHLQGGKSKYNAVQCEFSAKHRDEAAELNKGDEVTIKGLGSGTVLGTDPVLKGCSIVKK